MHRRELLRSAARSAAALALLPTGVTAEMIWQRVAQEAAAAPSARSTSADAQIDLVNALADTLLPRTDTPSATDVDVYAFVNVITLQYYSYDELNEYRAGLQAIDVLSRQVAGASFETLPEDQRAPVMDALEAPDNRDTLAGSTWRRLKRLIVHGYFTSERVQREVLEVQIMPGRFDGAAPLRVRTRSGGGAE